MIRLTLIFCVTFLIQSGVSGQFVKTPIFSGNEAINIQFIPGNGYFYYHEIKKGHTIYSLSKTFNIPVQDIYRINEMDRKSPVSIGQVIKIPVDPSLLNQGLHSSNDPNSEIPVYYTVKPKETVFRVAKIYFNQEVETLKARNNITTNELEIGQHLLVGWLNTSTAHRPINEVQETIEEYRNDGVLTRYPSSSDSITTTHDSVYVVVDSTSTTFYPAGFRGDLLGSKKFIKGMSIHTENTVAHWDKTIPDNGVAYALHNEAKPNTYIELFNPNLNRTIRAKVIGKIPFGTYTSDVKLLVSPRAAKMLGGLDHRFRVRATFITD